MSFVYHFDGASIPAWIRSLFWVLYFIPSLYFFKKLVLNKKNNIPNTIITYCFILYFTAYAIFYCIGDDYFAYRDWIYGHDFAVWTKEQIYVILIYFCRMLPTNYPYEMFRLIVWGSAIILVYFSARRYREDLKPGLVLFFLFVLYSSAFVYARASLAMAVFFTGLSLFFYAQGRLQKLLSMCLAISSFFFHHEMIVGIGLLPCLFIPFEKRRARLFLLILFAAGLAAVAYLIANPDIFDTFMGGDDMSNKMEQFNERKQGDLRLSTFINYIKYYLLIFLFNVYLRGDNDEINKSIIGLYRITCGILMVATAFVFVAGVRSTYTYRVLYISMIPLSIMLSYFYFNGYVKKPHMVIILVLAIMSNSVRFINSL